MTDPAGQALIPNMNSGVVFRMGIDLLLAATACSKLIALHQDVPMLKSVDRVLNMPMKGTVLLGMAIEVMVAAYVVFAPIRRAAYAVLALVVAFSGYRALAAMAGGRCGCLGTWTEWSPWMRSHETAILNAMLLWMAGSAVLVLVRTMGAGNPSHRPPATAGVG